jgi:aromatase
MIVHTMLYRFPEKVAEEERDEFLSVIRDMALRTGLVRGFDHKSHQALPADAQASNPSSEVIVQFSCDSLDALRQFSELPALHGLMGQWKTKLQFETVFLNHEPLDLTRARRPDLEHAEHAVSVDAALPVVWDVLVDVLKYPEIFPPTQEVSMIEERPGYQLARFVVSVGGEANSWVSRRDIDETRHIIAYEQVEKAPIIDHMGGEWRAFALADNRTQLVLTHDFAVRAPENGLVIGRFTAEEADELLKSTIERNSVADLGAVKSEAERRTNVNA